MQNNCISMIVRRIYAIYIIKNRAGKMAYRRIKPVEQGKTAYCDSVSLTIWRMKIRRYNRFAAYKEVYVFY